jgi:hypothetical protein
VLSNHALLADHSNGYRRSDLIANEGLCFERFICKIQRKKPLIRRGIVNKDSDRNIYTLETLALPWQKSKWALILHFTPDDGAITVMAQGQEYIFPLGLSGRQSEMAR